ncbi:uncharacterized protein LOC134820379 [Bolinopsis microptera]|uniref:uncharacterized protein LOC134820379 n=1 Tax=Bolinopsis microptera TaxID=2820187 RepID=UPI0030790F6A
MGFKKDKFDDIVETVPLLDVGDTAKVVIELEEKDEDDLFFEDTFNEVNPKNRIAQWPSDAVMLIITHAQIFLLLFSWSLNLKTPWSYQFTAAFSWMLYVTDYWSWYKIESAGFNVTVWPTDSGYANSENIPTEYYILTMGISITVVTLIAMFSVFYVFVSWSTSGEENHMKYLAYLRKWFVYVLELAVLPFGILAVRWWWCRYNGSDTRSPNPLHNATDVKPSETCLIWNRDMWTLVHALYPVLILLAWCAVPVYIFVKNKKHVFTDITIEHEGYILLKETEYVYGINEEWLLSGYYLLSSFRRKFVYMRCYVFVVKLMLIIVYGAVFDYEKLQAFLFTGIFFVLSGLVMVGRPYRIMSFNVMLFLSLFVHFCNAFVGVCIEMDTRNAFIQEDFLYAEMIMLNGGFYVLCAVWFTFLFMRWNKIVLRTQRPLWPNLTKTNAVKRDIDETTRKYLVSIIRANLTLQETYNTIPLLAPAHELSRRIKILNAYCREAMLIDHVFQHTMWDITDSLIQAHTAVFKKSIFSDCSLHGSRESARQLYAMLPCLAKRLKQRDEDLILMSRKRRRILLKMYTLSVFLSKHADRVRRELAEAKDNKGYDTDSEFEDDDIPRQENFSEPGLLQLNDSLLMDDSLVLTDSSTHETSETVPDIEDQTPPNVAVNSSFVDGSSSNTMNQSFVSSRGTPFIGDNNSFDRDVSALLDDSVFKDPGGPQTSTPQRTKRSSYAGVQQPDGHLSPSVERPSTSPYHNNRQVLSFRKFDDKAN